MATERYGKLKGLRPANTSEATLWSVPSGWQGVFRVSICNQDTVARSYRLAHVLSNTAASSTDWLAYDLKIPANATHRWVMEMYGEEAIRIKASVADKLTFIVSGLQIIPS